MCEYLNLLQDIFFFLQETRLATPWARLKDVKDSNMGHSPVQGQVNFKSTQPLNNDPTWEDILADYSFPI